MESQSVYWVPARDSCLIGEISERISGLWTGLRLLGGADALDAMGMARMLEAEKTEMKMKRELWIETQGEAMLWRCRTVRRWRGATAR